MADDVYTRRNRPAALALVAIVLGLFLAVVFVLPWYENQQPVSVEEQALFTEQMTLTTGSLQSLISEDLSATQMAEERAREDDETGQALSIRCLQWTDLYDSQRTEEAARQQEYACKRFNHYVTTGEVLPEPNFDESGN